MKGKAVLLDRGSCAFTQKAQAVTDAGGLAALLADTENTDPSDPLVVCILSFFFFFSALYFFVIKIKTTLIF
jgi:hypothetical protein